MSSANLQSVLSERFPEGLSDVGGGEKSYRATVARDALPEVCRTLRDDFGFDYLACLAGLDREECVEVVYYVYAIAADLEAVLRAEAPKDDCRVPSVSHVWRAALWHERETAEMLGVTFEGHPDPRHLLLPEGWIGHPLRKDYEPTPDYTRPSQLDPDVWAEFTRRVQQEY
ncbi:MAG: NADH-quinone oxidoreductase subunit C [Armatimonadota bacterium]|jgi:NADH-quinone oxidoreductase subunit C